MNPEQNQRQCAVCGESEPSFIHNVSNNGVFRQLCTDCLLKEHRELFCPVCLKVFVTVPSPVDRIICLNCPSITHLSCSPPRSSSAASSSASCYICPPCSDPNFTFFPKSRVPSSEQSGENDDDGSETPIDMVSARALVAAAKIAVISMKKAAIHLKNEALKKILASKRAKMRAKEALWNLQDRMIRENASDNNNPYKRKNSDR